MSLTDRIKGIFRSDSYKRSSNSSGIGTMGDIDRDPLAALTQTHASDLSDQGYLDLYEGSMLARTMVDHLSEDMVRAGWEFASEDEGLNDTINDRYGELKVQNKAQSMIEDDMIWGDGYTGIALEQPDLDIAEPVEPKTIESVEYLIDYDYDDITGHLTRREAEEEYETQKDLNEIVSYGVAGLARRVHADRMMHLQMRSRKGDDTGMSFFADKQLLLKVFHSTMWSVGQLLYQPAFKVIWTDLSEMSKEDVKKMRSRLETDLNVLTAFLLDKGDGDTPKDEIDFPSSSGGMSGVGDMLDFVEDLMSMAAKEPLSRLFGNAAGAISGAEEDTRGYYDRISGLQQSYLKPLLRKLNEYLLWENDIDPESLEWEIKFNDLWEYDEKTRSEIDLNRSKYYINLWKTGAISGSAIAEEEGYEAIDQSLPDNFDLPEGDED